MGFPRSFTMTSDWNSCTFTLEAQQQVCNWFFVGILLWREANYTALSWCAGKFHMIFRRNPQRKHGFCRSYIWSLQKFQKYSYTMVKISDDIWSNLAQLQHNKVSEFKIFFNHDETIGRDLVKLA